MGAGQAIEHDIEELTETGLRRVTPRGIDNELDLATVHAVRDQTHPHPSGLELVDDQTGGPVERRVLGALENPRRRITWGIRRVRHSRGVHDRGQMLDDDIRAGKEQGLVTVVPHDTIRRRTFSSPHTDDHPAPVGLAHTMTRHDEPISHCSMHCASFELRAPSRYRLIRPHLRPVVQRPSSFPVPSMALSDAARASTPSEYRATDATGPRTDRADPGTAAIVDDVVDEPPVTR